MLYTLVLLVCMSGSSQNCEVREQVVQDLAPMPTTAFIQAQALVANWIDEHPGYEVKSWRMQRGRGA